MSTESIESKVKDIASQIRSKSFHWNKRSYALGLLHAVWQAKHLEYTGIMAIELGVAGGDGLKSLYDIASFYKESFDIDIKVAGFDTGQGLPRPQDYRDHPELWRYQDFSRDPIKIRQNLPESVDLIIGDIKDTMPIYCDRYDRSYPLGFVSIDVDYYSSTVSSFPLFEMAPENYLPAVPVHVDDINNQLSLSSWTGEALALKEFNDSHPLRKFEEKHAMWRIDNFHVFHVFDHPLRTGLVKPLNTIPNVPI